MNSFKDSDAKYSALEEYNPYKEKKIDIEAQENNIEYVRVEEENDLYISVDDFRKAIELERYARFIKLICLLDGSLTLLNMLMRNPYYIFVGFIYYCGYQGANQYNKTYLQIYMTYEIIEVIAKLYLFSQIIQEKYALLLALSIFIDMYMLNMYNKFRRMLPEN